MGIPCKHIINRCILDDSDMRQLSDLNRHWHCIREPLGAAAYVEVDAVLNPPPRPPSFAIRRRRLGESRRTLGIFEVQSQQEVRRLHCSACTPRNHDGNNCIEFKSSDHN